MKMILFGKCASIIINFSRFQYNTWQKDQESKDKEVAEMIEGTERLKTQFTSLIERADVAESELNKVDTEAWIILKCAELWKIRYKCSVCNIPWFWHDVDCSRIFVKWRNMHHQFGSSFWVLAIINNQAPQNK